MPTLTTNQSNWSGQDITVEYEALPDGSFRWTQFDYVFDLVFHPWSDPDTARVLQSRGYYEIRSENWVGPLGRIEAKHLTPFVARAKGDFEDRIEEHAQHPVTAAVKLLCNII